MILSQRAATLFAVGLGVAAAAAHDVLGPGGPAPVIGGLSLLPAALLAGAAAVLLDALLRRRGVAPAAPLRVTAAGVAGILALGAALALPPVAIDLAIGFPEALNLPLPGALAFYPGIGLVAETAFHMLPLALIALPFRRGAPGWAIWPVVLVEPLFQVGFLAAEPLLGALVLANVALVSAAQLWLYRRHGFLAMIGLRWAFYLAWHIAWGQARLALLF